MHWGFEGLICRGEGAVRGISFSLAGSNDMIRQNPSIFFQSKQAAGAKVGMPVVGNGADERRGICEALVLENFGR